MKPSKISESTTHRLSIYLRCLQSLEEAGIVTASSRSLANQFDLNAAQIRKDLAYFGQFGVRGIGYSVAELRSRLTQIMGLRDMHPMCIVGGGNLGMALAEYPGCNRNGFCVTAIFEIAPEKVGKKSRTGVPIHDIREMASVVAAKRIQMAMIAVPAEVAQRVCVQVIDAGIRAILNFAPARLAVPAGVKVKSIDLSISLEGLSFFLARGSDLVRDDFSPADPALD